MLKSTEIKALLDNVTAQIPEIVNPITVYDDDDFARKRRDWDCLDTQLTAVAVLPNSNITGRNHDMARYNNNLQLFLVQAQDGKDDERNLAQIDFAIDIERQLTKLIQSWTGTLNCPVKNLELIGASFEPVRDYHTSIGVTCSYVFKRNV